MIPRLELVRQLVMAERDPQEVLDELASYGWDSDEEFRVSATPISAILKRYLRGEVSAAFVVDWANGIEVRDDIGFDESIASVARSIIHELANPDVEGMLTESRAGALTAELELSSHPLQGPAGVARPSDLDGAGAGEDLQ